MYNEQQIKDMVKRNRQYFNYHPFELPYGINTGGTAPSKLKLEKLQLPDDFKGASVIDIGCNLGFFLHECKKRNAGSLLGVDINQPTLDVAAELDINVLGNHVALMQAEFPSDANRIVGTFDYGIVMSVMHYMGDLDTVFKELAKIINKTLIAEVMICGDGEIDTWKPVTRRSILCPSKLCLESIMLKYFNEIEFLDYAPAPGDNSIRAIYKAHK